LYSFFVSFRAARMKIEFGLNPFWVEAFGVFTEIVLQCFETLHVVTW
jgi:hypothetical protein